MNRASPTACSLKISSGLLLLENHDNSETPRREFEDIPKISIYHFSTLVRDLLDEWAIFYAFRLNYDSWGGSILMNLNSFVCDLMRPITEVPRKIRLGCS